MNLSPKDIVKELDKYIVGQNNAKRAVAIALRNRYRRSKLPKELMEEVTPKNIIMRGPTGVGKTEIARRLAKLVGAPFVKVEATKYTEVGYVGRDCESMIRDLVEVSVRMVKEEKMQTVKEKAMPIVNKRLFDLVYPKKKNENALVDEDRERVQKALESGEYDLDVVELDVAVQPKALEISIASANEINLGDIFSNMMPGGNRRRKKLTIKQAREQLINEESSKLIDLDSVNSEAITRAEQEGIIFIDEIDKIAVKGHSNNQDVSREGVQRDILPFVEGCSVSTKYGVIKTDYILFIAAGAFHIANVENLIPELQGRFPIRVDLNNLTKDDFVKILKEPKNAITKQYAELLKVDNIELEFTEDALEEIALLAERENETNENIGARRLHTIIEKLLEDISFNADGSFESFKMIIDKNYVDNTFSSTLKKLDLNKFIL